MPWQVLAIQHRSNDTQHELVFKASVDKLASYYIRVLPTPKTLRRFQTVHSMQQQKSKIEPKDEADELVVQNSVSDRRRRDVVGERKRRIEWGREKE